MEDNEIVQALRSMLPKKVDYAELVGSPVPSSYGISFVYSDDEDYVIEQAADLIEKQQVDNDRKTELLKACLSLLEKQNDSPVTLNLLCETVFYDEANCDGYCLIEDIKACLNRL